MLRSIAVAAAILCGCVVHTPGEAWAETVSIAAPADPLVGTYDVKGEPFGGGKPYTGIVNVEKTGQTYKVLWYPGEHQIEGVGIWWGGQLSIGYVQEGVQGVAIYVPMGNGLRGVWSSYGETRIAPEDWVKR